MNDLLDQAANAETEAGAVSVLMAGGYPRDYAEEAAAIMFGSSQGDIIESDQLPPLTPTERAELCLRNWDRFTWKLGDLDITNPGDSSG